MPTVTIRQTTNARMVMPNTQVKYLEVSCFEERKPRSEPVEAVPAIGFSHLMIRKIRKKKSKKRWGERLTPPHLWVL
jgi:hypothetical protein